MADFDPVTPTAPLRPLRERREHRGRDEPAPKAPPRRRRGLTDDDGDRRDDAPGVDDYA